MLTAKGRQVLRYVTSQMAIGSRFFIPRVAMMLLEEGMEDGELASLASDLSHQVADEEERRRFALGLEDNGVELPSRKDAISNMVGLYASLMVSGDVGASFWAPLIGDFSGDPLNYIAPIYDLTCSEKEGYEQFIAVWCGMQQLDDDSYGKRTHQRKLLSADALKAAQDYLATRNVDQAT